MATQVINKTATYLTFKLGQEDYAIDVLKVKEILEVTRITKVPKTPNFMKGVINLRGNVVPVVDMHLKFGIEKTEQTVDTCIIVLEVTIDKETVVLGALADTVQEVVNIEPENIEATPHVGTHLNTEFILGIGKMDEQFVIILNIDKIFSEEEITVVKSAAHTEGV
ncbi:MAG: chemotaxis protein CheW [Spirochaetales bacterium]|nr:chemotaxis protein CheW [Spirochaetales bacterium]